MTLTLGNFFMVFGRLTGLFISAPIFSNRQMPGRIKILIIILLAGVMTSFVPITSVVVLDNPAYFIAALIMEIFVGYCMGFLAYLIFSAIQLAGQLMDTQMGFGIVNVLDPESGTQIPLMGNFCYLLALLIYLVLDGHHYLLNAIIRSYQIIPVMGANLGSDFVELFMDVTVYMFVIAVQIAAPIIITLMITNVAMGFIARTVPQMNVFIVGLPLNIMAGLGALLVLMPIYIWFMSVMFAKFLEYLDALLLAMGI
ncbi:MAG: flagellar biosynthetic protein FliR [Syntrophomonas sp.]|nr:flagellar biosynthetic protein FliR [Syntrophomonas sp.]